MDSRVSQRSGQPDRDMRGQRITDDSFILCFNAHHEPIEFTLPPEEFSANMIDDLGRCLPTYSITRNSADNLTSCT